MDHDLFGEPVSEKKRRRRRVGSPKPQADSSRHQARQLELAPPAPGLDDLVARLKPLHHRLEADLAWNGRFYTTKQVRPIFADEPGEIVVVTVYS